MKRLIMGALMFSLASYGWTEDCIKIDEEDFNLVNNDIGSAVVQWRAALKNSCRSTLDADLTITLLNSQSEPVYEMLDKATLGVEERIEVEKEVYVPSRIVDEVEDFSIQILERQRQY